MFAAYSENGRMEYYEAMSYLFAHLNRRAPRASLSRV